MQCTHDFYFINGMLVILQIFVILGLQIQTP